VRRSRSESDTIFTSEFGSYDGMWVTTVD
jgi:hypothetical protein